MKTENEIRNLTGIRAFAALWVVIFHWQTIQALKAAPLLHSSPILGRGYWAVDLFFVLSGFIIGTVYHSKFSKQADWPTYKKYLLLRVGRLYPIHFVLFLAYAGLFAVSSSLGSPMGKEGEYTAQQAVAHLTLTHAWHWADGLSWNWPSWSISAEFFAYALLFPLYWFVFHRVGWRGALVLLSAVWLAAYGYGQSSGLGFKTYDSGLLRIAAEFMCGYLLFFLSRKITLSGRQAGQLFVLSVCAMGVLCYMPTTWEVLLLPCLGGLILSLYYGNTTLNRVFGNRVTVYLGHISYSLYMVHDLVNLLTGQVLGRIGVTAPLTGISAIGLMVGLLLISQIGAAMGFHLVENPARNWMKRKLQNPHAFSIGHFWRTRRHSIGNGIRVLPWYTAPAAACLSCCSHGHMVLCVMQGTV